MNQERLAEITKELKDGLASLSEEERIDALNILRGELHEISPFKNEPVDFVYWVKTRDVVANDYNPNAVAPPEMKLLELSIEADGYTQPVVTDFDDTAKTLVVIDGFHRNRVARESAVVRERVKGYLPVVQIRDSQTGRPDRIASTIRHNRARGKHQVEKMSEIVVELKKRNWSDERIGKELGMDPDEVLRLAQITGLAEAFKDDEFSEAWEPAEGAIEAGEDDVALEWINSPIPSDVALGWTDRTEQSSVLYGMDPRVMGLVQKSHVLDKWHWYAYTQPMQAGEHATRDGAKGEVLKAWDET